MMSVNTYTTLIKSLDNRALELLGIAIATYYLSVFIYALRWKIVLGGMGKTVPLTDLLKINLSSIFVNNITPMSRGGGEILRITWVSKKHRVPVAVSTASILYERISEIVPILILVVLGVSYFATHLILFVMLLSVIVVVIWFKWDKIIRLSIRIFKVNLTQEDLVTMLELRKKPAVNILAIGLSSMVWFLDVMRLKLIAMAFGWSPPLTFLSVVSLANLLFGLLAFTPGGIGIVEGGLMGTLTYFGIPSTLAISVTLLERFISYVSSTVIGFIALVTSGGVEIWKALRLH
ncbi:flippase-like domain-containing protein [Thermococcus sp. LS1]|uniref:lysylphosphatidylglycerol synthase transmembrane domain-containing protein n=1 Tax=Thermococcus sp. LS1 TaxID=1638259 RepID=UPI00143A7DD7|nr:lysylphosphatidylglycerol synthase transmembrane domain-containing protein [Thermococcus sp. LS1]NJD99671.1 flippase-like domain-containing protein [Thermococcus sp. LS1]